MSQCVLALCLGASSTLWRRSTDAQQGPCAQSLVALFLIGVAWLIFFGGAGRGGHGRA